MNEKKWNIREKKRTYEDLPADERETCGMRDENISLVCRLITILDLKSQIDIFLAWITHKQQSWISIFFIWTKTIIRLAARLT